MDTCCHRTWEDPHPHTTPMDHHHTMGARLQAMVHHLPMAHHPLWAMVRHPHTEHPHLMVHPRQAMVDRLLAMVPRHLMVHTLMLLRMIPTHTRSSTSSPAVLTLTQ